MAKEREREREREEDLEECGRHTSTRTNVRVEEGEVVPERVRAAVLAGDKQIDGKQR